MYAIRSYYDTFNYYFDKFLFLPVVNTYEFIMPDYVEDRVSNFVDNIFEFNNFTNNLLQLKFSRITSYNVCYTKLLRV